VEDMITIRLSDSGQMPGQEEELRELRVFDISLHGKRGAVNGNHSQYYVSKITTIDPETLIETIIFIR
jgi:hypothetical protein